MAEFDWVQDPNSDQWYNAAGDINDEANWTYQAPGVPAPVDQFNWVQDPNSDQQYNASGDINDPANWRMFGPGESAPDDLGEFSNPNGSTHPDAAAQTEAIQGAIDAALGPTEFGHLGEKQYTPEELAEIARISAQPGSEASRTGRSATSFQAWRQDVEANASNNWAGWGPPPTGWPEGNSWPPPGAPDKDWNQDINGRVADDQRTNATAMGAGTGNATSDPTGTTGAVAGVGGNSYDGSSTVNTRTGPKNIDDLRKELGTAGFPQALTAPPDVLLAAYERAGAPGAARPAAARSAVPGPGSTLADYQRYVNSVIESNQKRYADERSDKDRDYAANRADQATEKARLERAQKLAIISELLRMSTGPGGPRNLSLALSLMMALDNITAAERSAIQLAAPANMRKRVLGQMPVGAVA